MEQTLDKDVRQYHELGFIHVKGLLSKEEINELIENFNAMHKLGKVDGCFEARSPEESDGDILKVYPRMMHPHRVNEVAMRYMLHPKIKEVLEKLLAEEPLAAQSMFYWKPPGARGQALHQDNYYLRAEPGTCIAAWVAVDPADPENGGMSVVPKTNNLEVICPREADPALSFTRDEIDVPEGMEAVPVVMEAGDALFFNGSMIHGSTPNTSKDRFRRAFICHYIGQSSTKISHWYNPIYNFNREIVNKEDNGDLTSGPCGGEETEIKGPH